MAFSKITNADRLGKGNVGQPDTPLLSTTEMQEQMDSLANLGIDRFNAFLDEIAAPSASSCIGCSVPDGIDAQPNLTSVLNGIATEAIQSEAIRHTHGNKIILDSLTSNIMQNINALLLLMSNVDTIDIIVTNSSSAIPTSNAVQNFVANYNYKTIIKNAIYPIGAVYQTTLESPDIVFGTTNEWTLLSDVDGVKTYRRAR